MFAVTETASEYLNQVLIESDHTEKACFRISLADQGLTLEIDEPRSDDSTIENNGQALILLDPVTVMYLDDCVLDFNEQTSDLVLVKQ